MNKVNPGPVSPNGGPLDVLEEDELLAEEVLAAESVLKPETVVAEAKVPEKGEDLPDEKSHSTGPERLRVNGGVRGHEVRLTRHTCIPLLQCTIKMHLHAYFPG